MCMIPTKKLGRRILHLQSVSDARCGDRRESRTPLTLRGRIGVAQGNAGAFCLNGSPVGEGRDLTLPEQPGPNVFGVNYAPGIYTTVNSQVVYTVTVEDDAGFAQSFDIGHRFANRLRRIYSLRDG